MLCLLISAPALSQQESWIDVRSTMEYYIDSIEGDVHIPHQQIVEGVSLLSLNKTSHIKLYCRSGVRSERAMKALLNSGYTNVENVGGIEDVRRLRQLNSN